MSSVPVEVVALALQRKSDSKYFLARRGPGNSGAGHWEFPGGKVDAGETQVEALVREIKEELAMTIDPQQLSQVGSHFFKYPTKEIHLHLWTLKTEVPLDCEIFYELSEHDQVMWCRPEQMKSLLMSPADIFFNDKLL